jgi:hypothetical protein
MLQISFKILRQSGEGSRLLHVVGCWSGTGEDLLYSSRTSVPTVIRPEQVGIQILGIGSIRVF